MPTHKRPRRSRPPNSNRGSTDSITGPTAETSAPWDSDHRPPPDTIGFTFGAPWQIVMPRVYRYEDQKWIDEFFASGELKLSTFDQFATYDHPDRGDKAEGSNLLKARVGTGVIMAASKMGHNVLVMCTSLRLDRSLCDIFQRDSVFEITNTVGFAREVSRQLLGFNAGWEGSCIYTDGKIINRVLPAGTGMSVGQDGEAYFTLNAELLNQLGGVEQLFNKPLSYSKQAEYRMVWVTEESRTEPLVIRAPLARQFCRRVKFPLA